MPYLKNVLLFIVLCSLLTITILAQNKETGISITVKDEFNATIPNATVILSQSNKNTKQVVTDETGIAVFYNLAAGEYQITVLAEGFKKYESSKLTVKTNQLQKLEITLELPLIESKVEVGENGLSEGGAKSGTTIILNEREIASLPDDPQELERVIKRMGESITGENLPISVNGAEGGKLPPKQAIQQIRINQNVFSAQYDNPYGGGIEIFTKATVDRFTKYFSFNFADSRFNAADPFIFKRVPYQSKGYFFVLSGPLLGKKASFTVSASHRNSASSAVVNAVVLNSNLHPTEFKQTYATPTESDNFSLSTNIDPTKKHKLYLSYNWGSSRAEGQNVGDFSLPSRASQSSSQSHYLQFSHTYLPNPNIVSQTRFLTTYMDSENFGASNNQAVINVLDAFLGGDSQVDSSSKSLTYQIANDTSWQMGRYTLGFGWRLRGERVNQNSKSNFGGTYTFSGRLAPILDANNNPVSDSAGNITSTQISSLESYRRTLLFQRLDFSNQRIRELGGGANQFTISGGNPEIELSQHDYAFYLQNSYKISETLATSFGVRYENQSNIDSNSNFAPRFGLIWAPKAKEKQNPLFTLPKVSIGYGFFYTRFPLNSTLSIRQASDTDRAQYLITDSNILDTYPNVPSVALLQQFALPRTSRFIDTEFNTQYQSQVNATATKKMPEGFSISFTLSRSKSSRLPFTQNINAPLAGTYNPLLLTSVGTKPFGNTGNIYQTRSIGKADNTRFSINLFFPETKILFTALWYSFTKSKSNVVSGSGSPIDPYDFSQEFAPTATDGVHRIGGHFYLNLPYKFTISSDYAISSGTRFNIFTGRDTNGDGFFSERPAFASDLSKPNLISTPYGIFDPNPAPTDKLIPRNLGRGPKTFTFDTYISKSFGFGEDKINKKPARQTLQLSVTINNLFNIINKGAPIGNMSSPNFLRSLSGSSDGSIVISNGVRQASFAGRSMYFNVDLFF